jgi:hypothetical protein
MLTSKEATYYKIYEANKEYPGRVSWLEMPSGEVLVAGNKPKNIEKNIKYKIMLEQIQFFHGDIDLLLKNKSPTWINTLDPAEASRMMNQVLANPLFQNKKQYYDLHYKEFFTPVQNGQHNIDEANVLNHTQSQEETFTPEHIEEDERKAKKSLDVTAIWSGWLLAEKSRLSCLKNSRIINTKIALLENLKKDLHAEGSAPSQKIDNFYQRINDAQAIELLTTRRYLSRGIIHLGKVFMKGALLCVPALGDIMTLGVSKFLTGSSLTAISHSRLFQITGKKFIVDVQRIDKEINAA